MPETITKIEEVYENFCKDENNYLYFQTYDVVKARLAISYYPLLKMLYLT